jgi:transposase InsO family protein
VLLELRRKHPTWGPRTLLYALKRREPKLEFPAASTVGDILKREGLIHSRARRPRFASPYVVGGQAATHPNNRWTGDYKGHFRMLNGVFCYPLTLRDQFSRLLLDVRGFQRVLGADVIEVLTAAFQQYGLPDEFHADTGSPFGSHGLARLSQVSVFVLKQGVRPLFSRPGKPQDNGGHERMHKDLKTEATRPPGKNLAQQQKKLDEFRSVFNNERPHHSLGGDTPASRWAPSPRAYKPNPTVSYPKNWEVRMVSAAGDIHWSGKLVTVSKALHNERIGLEPIDDGLWRVHFATLCIGLFDESAKRRRILGLRPELRAA